MEQQQLLETLKTLLPLLRVSARVEKKTLRVEEGGSYEEYQVASLEVGFPTPEGEYEYVEVPVF